MINEKRLKLLISTAESMGLKPELLTDYGLVSFQLNGKSVYLLHKASNPNSYIASYLSKNKHAARVIFENNGLPNIPYCLPTDRQKSREFLEKHGRVIVKPIAGEHSSNIHLVNNVQELEALDLKNCVMEKFVEGQEVRFLVVDGEVEAVHHKVYPGDINDPETVRRVSLKKEDWDEDMTAIAKKAAEAIGLIFTAVDFIQTEDGEAYLLEINSAPGIDRFQEPNQGPAIDMMRMYLEQVVKSQN